MLSYHPFLDPCKRATLIRLLLWTAVIVTLNKSFRCVADELQGRYIISTSNTSYDKTSTKGWQSYRTRQDVLISDVTRTKGNRFTAVVKGTARLLLQQGRNATHFSPWSNHLEYKECFDLSTVAYESEEMPAGSEFWTYEGGGIGLETLFLPIEKQTGMHPKAASGIVDISSHPSLAPHFTGTWSYDLGALNGNQRQLHARTVLQSEDKQFAIFGTTSMRFQVQPLKFLRIEYTGEVIPANREKKGFVDHFMFLREYETAVGEEALSSQVVYHSLMVPADSPEGKAIELPTSLSKAMNRSD
jgi:hypothetical protein